jgi:hypothetical protein
VQQKGPLEATPSSSFVLPVVDLISAFYFKGSSVPIIIKRRQFVSYLQVKNVWFGGFGGIGNADSKRSTGKFENDK